MHAVTKMYACLYSYVENDLVLIVYSLANALSFVPRLLPLHLLIENSLRIRLDP